MGNWKPGEVVSAVVQAETAVGEGVGGVGFGGRAEQPGGLDRKVLGRAPGCGLSDRLASRGPGKSGVHLWCSLFMMLSGVSALGGAGRLGCPLDSGCLGLQLGQSVSGPGH